MVNIILLGSMFLFISSMSSWVNTMAGVSDDTVGKFKSGVCPIPGMDTLSIRVEAVWAVAAVASASALCSHAAISAGFLRTVLARFPFVMHWE
tara:strand:+ start:393861 stop:394139 length:279 start_codon:yes stop_codon:yes gene_type:complete